MPELFFADLVRESSTSTGIQAFALEGAAPGHRRFTDVVPPGRRFHYAIASITHEQQWEVGEGEIVAGELDRRAVLTSSAGDAAVDFLPGLKIVTLTVGSAWFAERDDRSGHGHAVLAVGDGSANAPSISFADDSDTGMFRPVGDAIGISAGGTEKARFVSSGGLGIGTQTPAGGLHVRWNSFHPLVNTSAALTLEGAYGGGLVLQDSPGFVGFWASEGGDTLNIGLGAVAHSHILQITGSHLRPMLDSTLSLGDASRRWAQLYAATGTINTSDAQAKHWQGGPDADEIAAGLAIIADLGFFQWTDAVQAKGPDQARRHFGIRAQNAFAIMADHGLDWRRYGWCCHDRWTDDDGEHERFGIRSDQLALFLIAVLARQCLGGLANMTSNNTQAPDAGA